MDQAAGLDTLGGYSLLERTSSQTSGHESTDTCSFRPARANPLAASLLIYAASPGRNQNSIWSARARQRVKGAAKLLGIGRVPIEQHATSGIQKPA